MSDLTYEGEKLTTKDGLLFADGEMVPLPLADYVAQHHGFVYVERLVKYLEEQKETKP